MEAIGQFQRAAELETTRMKAAGVPVEYDWHNITTPHCSPSRTATSARMRSALPTRCAARSVCRRRLLAPKS